MRIRKTEKVPKGSSFGLRTLSLSLSLEVEVCMSTSLVKTPGPEQLKGPRDFLCTRLLKKPHLAEERIALEVFLATARDWSMRVPLDWP